MAIVDSSGDSQQNLTGSALGLHTALFSRYGHFFASITADIAEKLEYTTIKVDYFGLTLDN
ncbi:hypothetical protein DFR28_10149 [Arenicella xantha]|uniref:Uncharacterized protein n=1 Tax=Arenicella xantha TaxID=644221 RepID=A0A395JMH9_9GAMM|nr:hypothetical protein DFR28_10149 [Arenicella xantha]